jgi:hypothetical protein
MNHRGGEEQEEDTADLIPNGIRFKADLRHAPLDAGEDERLTDLQGPSELRVLIDPHLVRMRSLRSPQSIDWNCSFCFGPAICTMEVPLLSKITT